MVKNLQKNLRKKISSAGIEVSKNPGMAKEIIQTVFPDELIFPFLRAVGMNARLKFGSIVREFVQESRKLQEDFDPAQVEAEEVDRFLDREFYGKTITERMDEIRAGIGIEATKIYSEAYKSGLGYRDVQKKLYQAFAIGGYQLERLVRTEGQRISNDILLRTYEKNKEWVDGIMFQATLDVRTCETCAQYDRHEFWYKGSPSVMHAPYVPMHCFCRCVYVPISKAWRSNKQLRAAMFGPVDKNYKEWLWNAEQNSPEFAKPILGKNYEDWKAGKYELQAQFTPQITYANYLNQTRSIR